MPIRRRTHSASHMRRTSRKVHDHTVGTHVSKRTTSAARRNADFTQGIRRRATVRRVLTAVVAIAIVVGVALAAGLLAFRGSVGSEMALRGSDADKALSAPKSGQAYYTLITAEVGAIAQPLETAGPDIIMLARIDDQRESLALVNIPPTLQVTEENKTVGIGSVSERGDAALIEAVETFAKVDVAHIVKIDEAGIAGMVDALGGLSLDIDQVIDDPHAGDVYLPSGPFTLDGETSLVYLRADNLKLGFRDKMWHQLNFASLMLEKIFAAPGNFQTRLESISSFFQTDCSLSDFESVAAWLSKQSASDIVTANLPGYTAEATDVAGDGAEQFIASSQDMAAVIEALDEGRKPPSDEADAVDAASSTNFTVDVQNGTSIAGAAAATAEQLADKGFSVGDVGNAEQQVYEETLVVYKDDEGLAKAKAVIEALDVGRPVEAGSYYSFASDVLLIIGSDYPPVA